MFGHDDHKDEDDNTAIEPTADASLAANDPAGVAGGDTGPVHTDDSYGAGTMSTDSGSTEPPAENNDGAPDVIETPEITANSSDESSANPTPATSGATATADTDDLLDLKKNALEELAPLVDHLDQSPEERFKTTMMMIQATDASGLIQHAYAAAKDIPDEKARAQALLDIVNEINYFTHANNNSAASNES